MYQVLGALKSLAIRIKNLKVDNGVFRLHYRVTVLILLAFSILVTSKQYIGDPIDCLSIGSPFRDNLLDNYCWVSSTFTVPGHCHKKPNEKEFHPCVGNFKPGDEFVTHQYYQWVCFVLFLQGLMFYFPHYLWKSWEGGRLKALTIDLEGPTVSDEVKSLRINALTAYFNVSLHRHAFYGYRHVICEVLNFVNVVGQMFLTNRFLGGTFLKYGTDVVEFAQMDQWNRTDPMVMVFPRVTKCTFNSYGTGGDEQVHDTMCVLPINIINEKIYIVLWFWFIILAVLSGLAVLYRLATILSPQFRFLLLRGRAKSISTTAIDHITSSTGFGDWFLLYLMAKNINSHIFKDVVDVVTKQLDSHGDESPESKEFYKKKYPL